MGVSDDLVEQVHKDTIIIATVPIWKADFH